MSESSSPHCRLVLLGQVGAGKSATGNTILGQQKFQSKRSLRAETQDVQCGKVSIDGHYVKVYDTPGFLRPGVQSGDTERKCQTLVESATSVPTVFLLVISTDRFTEQEQKAASLVLDFLGHNNLQNTSIIFTKGDELEDNDMTIEQFMENSEELKELVEKLNRRYHVINNKQDPRNRNEEVIGQIMNANMIISQNQLSFTEQTREQNLEMEDDRDQGCSSDPAAAALISPNFSDENNNLPPRKILLLGKTGVGKSATGNTILGKVLLRSEKDVNAVTTESSEKHADINGRKVSVIDTPGFFDTKLRKNKLAEELGRSLHLSEGGVDAVLLIFEYGRFTEQEADMLRRVEEVFGEDVTKHVIIVFTHGDECDPKKLQSGIEENAFLPGVIERCGGRYCVFNNRGVNNREQVSKLLEMVDTIIVENGGICFTNEMFKTANMGTFDYVLHLLKDVLLWAIGILAGVGYLNHTLRLI